ncbi:ketosteroid isomerase-like protein [Pelomonas saccharophila]|uniref:Ketosteroid isomerase-like protein n=1 Tax=Roseateles saccharophilus TaxID=304 RepID=A0ABU1YNR5_ROSSA|nr:nuclear transport factor 2 family protein [Roseateles saccharophilus]MDR7270373.1 ketosteroid isomerase-like protein [Roseateles saccharophilus]
MKAIHKLRTPLTAVACLLMLLLGSGCTSAPKVVVSPPLRCDDPASHCVNELMLALEDWKDAYNSRDPRRLQQLYAPGALITDDEYTAVPLSGEAVPVFFDQMAQRPTARMRWIIGNLQFFGDTAVRSGEYEFTEQVDGQTKERPGRYSFAYRRVADRWLIVLQHSTLRP